MENEFCACTIANMHSDLLRICPLNRVWLIRRCAINFPSLIHSSRAYFFGFLLGPGQLCLLLSLLPTDRNAVPLARSVRSLSLLLAQVQFLLLRVLLIYRASRPRRRQCVASHVCKTRFLGRTTMLQYKMLHKKKVN